MTDHLHDESQPPDPARSALDDLEGGTSAATPAWTLLGVTLAIAVLVAVALTLTFVAYLLA